MACDASFVLHCASMYILCIIHKCVGCGQLLSPTEAYRQGEVSCEVHIK